MSRKRQGCPASRKASLMGRCVYCGRAGEVWDHLVPWSVGGRNGDNLVSACNECNMVAGGRSFQSLDEKRGWIKARLERKHWIVLHGRFPPETREATEQAMLLDRLRWQA